jgi:hypothetical protein
LQIILVIISSSIVLSLPIESQSDKIALTNKTLVPLEDEVVTTTSETTTQEESALESDAIDIEDFILIDVDDESRVVTKTFPRIVKRETKDVVRPKRAMIFR